MKKTLAALIAAVSLNTAYASLEGLERDPDLFCVYVGAGSELVQQYRQSGMSKQQTLAMVATSSNDMLVRYLAASTEYAYAQLPLETPPRVFAQMSYDECMGSM